MKLAGKTNAELVAMREAICADATNRMLPGSFYLYTPKARKKLDDIDRAITDNLRQAKLAAGQQVNEAGYSGRQTNRR